MSREVNDFCRKYDAVVGPSTRAHRRVKRLDITKWQTNFDIVDTAEYQQVPMVEVHMPEDRFRALLEHDDWLDDAAQSIPPWQAGASHAAVARAINLVDQHDEECRLRAQYPALQDLYQQYLSMLKLVS